MDPNSIKEAGLKLTAPRLRILEVLTECTTTHFGAEDIYQHLKDKGEEVGLATVYRVLSQFEQVGLVRRLHLDPTQSVFELAHEHHDHIVCLDCGRIVEFCDPLIEAQQKKLSSRLGFELAEHQHVLYGHCTQHRCVHERESTSTTPDAIDSIS